MCMTRDGVNFDLHIESHNKEAKLDLCRECNDMFMDKIIGDYNFLQYIRDKILNDPVDYERFHNR